ncbi:MAG: threonine/serine dehydratase [Vicinamibacterales bacterium]|nr:threonine/serine dehydratase [Vicinamibacterales bacterium]
MKLAHVFVARQRIEPYVRRTPLVHSPWISAHTGANVRLKLESIQVTNSFKARGAVNASVARLEGRAGDPQKDAVIVTASAGNHGRAMAYAAERLGLQLVVFTPADAPRAKLDHITRHGADLRAVAPSYEAAELMAKQFAADSKVTYISPYSHPDIIAGAATVALEIVEEWPSVEAIVVPVGGGGLISGVAVAVKAISPGIEVIGVEAEASPAFHTSLAAGRITTVEVRPTLADGLAGNMDPETITFDYVRRLVDRVELAPEKALEDAVRALVAHEHLIAEGAGATAVAGLLNGIRPRGVNVAVIVSGSNIDAARLAGLLVPRT